MKSESNKDTKKDDEIEQEDEDKENFDLDCKKFDLDCNNIKIELICNLKFSLILVFI